MKTFKSVMLSGAIALAMTGGAFANDEKPKYGGSVEIGTVYVTLSALSWDAQDFNWKHNHDTGLVYEQLFAADLSKSVKAGGKHPFVADAWLPSDAIRGELAESWEWKENPLRIEIKLRKGIMWPDKPGVMKSREFVADDVLFAYTRLDESPRKIKGYFDHIAKAHALDKHTVVFEFKDYFAEWDYRFGYGYFSGIYPKEVVEAGASNWKNVNGTGPYMLTDFVSGNSNVYTKNEGYWDKDKIGGQDYKLPFIDKITYRTIKDEATYITALRTGKLDILESIRWQNVDSLKKSAPQLKWNRWLNMSGTFLAFRVDVDSPLKDVRVRRALNMAVNRTRSSRPTTTATPNSSPIRCIPTMSAISSRLPRCLPRCRSCSSTTRPRPRSCWRRPAMPRASPSRPRSARAIPTTWTCCRWSPPISSRSASRWKSSRWSTVRS